MRAYLISAAAVLAASVVLAQPGPPNPWSLSLSGATIGPGSGIALGPGSSGGTSPYSFIVAQSCGFANASSGCTTAAINDSGATLLVAVLVGVAPPLDSISDSSSNTWTTKTAIGASDVVQFAYVFNPSTSASHTFTMSGAGNNFGALAVAAFSGGQKIFDAQSAGAGGTSASPQGGSLTPAGNNELIVAGVENHDGAGPTINSIDSSFIIPTNGIFQGRGGQNTGVGLAYLLQGAAGAVNPTWTLSGSDTWEAQSTAFK